MGEKSGRTEYLMKNTAIFALGKIAPRAISFFLVPLYTVTLSSFEYGIIDLVMTAATVIYPVITLNICEAVIRFAMDKDAEHDKITQIGTDVFLASCIVGTLVIPACSLIQNLSRYRVFVYMYVITLAGSRIYLSDLRGKEMLIPYAVGIILQTLTTAVLNIFFLVVLKKGVEGYLAAYILSSFLAMAYALIVGKGYRSFRFHTLDRKLMGSMASYSLVLIPNSFMWWIMNSSDRIMVSAMVGVAANGIYAISYKVPSLVTTAASAFNWAWEYSAVKEEGSEDEEAYHNRIFICLVSFSMVAGIILCTFMKPFLRVYVAADYFEAWKYTPFLIVGCVYLTLGTFISSSYRVHKDSFGLLFSGIFGAVFNVAFNFILIPMIGVYGAAVATCASYVLVFAFRLIHTRKYLRYYIKNKEFIAGSVMLTFSAALMFLESAAGQILQIILLGAAILFYANVQKETIRRILGKIKKDVLPL